MHLKFLILKLLKINLGNIHLIIIYKYFIILKLIKYI